MYDFDTAVADAANPQGCGVAEHPIECLCDVHLSRTPEPTGRLMTLPCTADDFANHMAYELEKQAVLASLLRNGATADTLLEAAEQLKIEFGGGGGTKADAHTRSKRMRELIGFMLSGGLPLRAVARLTCIDAPVLVTLATRGNVQAKATAVAAADELLRQPFDNFEVVAQQVGTDRWVLRSWAEFAGLHQDRDGARRRIIELVEGGANMAQALPIVNAEFRTNYRPKAGWSVMWRHRKTQAAA